MCEAEVSCPPGPIPVCQVRDESLHQGGVFSQLEVEDVPPTSGCCP